MAGDYREIIETKVLGPARFKQLWSAAYFPAFPVALANFPVGGLLPAVLYLARWGHRRGNGRFAETFRSREGARVTIGDIAHKLIEEGKVKIEGAAGEAILADLLAGHCFDTKNGEARSHSPVLRAYPVHYLASWLDVDTFSHLRGVPELLTALLADQREGETVGWTGDKKGGHFQVGGGYEHNLLLHTLGPAMRIVGHASSLTSDYFDASQADGLTLEQVLMVQTALLVGEAPGKARGARPEIPNQQPIARQQAAIFRDDLRIFLEAYHQVMPWQAFVAFLEVAIGIGLFTTFLATAQLLFAWEQSGELPQEDSAWPIFVDVSNGSDHRLRQLSEESLEQAYRAMESLPVVMATLRVLDTFASAHPVFKNRLPPAFPDGRDRINALGDIYHQRFPQSYRLLDQIEDCCQQLAAELENEELAPDVVLLLRSDTIPAPARLGEAIVRLMGPVSQEENFVKFLSSCLIGTETSPLSLVRRRRARRNNRIRDARSLVLNNTALDYLVHRHLRKNGKHRRSRLTFLGFLDILRDHYGLYVDEAPPGMTVPAELLLQSRWTLERRLRDQGLLIGVNDAESMKFLRSRLAEVAPVAL